MNREKPGTEEGRDARKEQQDIHNPFKEKEVPEQQQESLKEDAEAEQQRKEALTERD
ncbi:MAG TPA: hypothetical protein VHK91_11000 [Flavisolibacter sp.]|jgi:hypothetical protein|nr:hypothetical protein [Flavisolibacter sp.]